MPRCCSSCGSLVVNGLMQVSFHLDSPTQSHETVLIELVAHSRVGCIPGLGSDHDPRRGGERWIASFLSRLY